MKTIPNLRVVIIILLAAFATAFSADAQGERFDKKERQKALAEIKAYRQEFLVKELSLTKEQQNAFFPIYDKMNEQLQNIADETRAIEKKVKDDSSDAELEAASMMLFAQKQREGAVEMEYYEKFKQVLSPRQMVKLKGAERKFTRKLVNHHRKN